MAIQTKRAQTGFIGEFYIYSELIKRDKRCFITLGNAKSVDIIIISEKKRAFLIDVKSSRTLMSNLHKHDDYDDSYGKIGRWQLSIKNYWLTHPSNTDRDDYEFADFYIFHNVNNQNQNIIVTGKELETLMHDKISRVLKKERKKKLSDSQICNWDICEFCFGKLRKYNQWGRLP